MQTSRTLEEANDQDCAASQAILRHSNVGLTINVYIKSVTESQVRAMDVLEAKFKETSNNLATPLSTRSN